MREVRKEIDNTIRALEALEAALLRELDSRTDPNLTDGEREDAEEDPKHVELVGLLARGEVLRRHLERK